MVEFAIVRSARNANLPTLLQEERPPLRQRVIRICDEVIPVAVPTNICRGSLYIPWRENDPRTGEKITYLRSAVQHRLDFFVCMQGKRVCIVPYLAFGDASLHVFRGFQRLGHAAPRPRPLSTSFVLHSSYCCTNIPVLLLWSHQPGARPRRSHHACVARTTPRAVSLP